MSLWIDPLFFIFLSRFWRLVYSKYVSIYIIEFISKIIQNIQLPSILKERFKRLHMCGHIKMKQGRMETSSHNPGVAETSEKYLLGAQEQ